MLISRTLARSLLLLCIPAATTVADEPDPFQDAIAAWHMDSFWDQDGHVAKLEPVGGRAHVNLPLHGDERQASLVRGGNGLVASLRDAAFNLGQGLEDQLNPTGNQLSMALRLDNPTNHWDVTLFSKHGGHEQLVYNIFAFTADDGGVELGVEIGTENKLGRANTVIARGDLNGWLDIIARYDGKRLELFVNGQLRSSSRLSGPLRLNRSEPVILGGEHIDGQLARRFTGDIDYAALWDRALTNDEIAYLSDYEPVPPYTEPYRPQFHFTPKVNWINDPNGLMYHDGRFHLFYQYNPFGTRWGHMSWGHATSTDLVHWKEQSVALYEEEGVMIFSGSAVHDLQNTSGFADENAGDGPLVAIYTGHDTNRGRQTQDLAYSTDAGQTWTKYEGNPVLDIDEANFRDPKVFWYEPDERWIMVVALANARKVQFYGSPDLKNWEHLSDFGPAGASEVPNWECPDLFQLPVAGSDGEMRWVLQVDIGGNAIGGGSGAQYFIGDFDGMQFHHADDDDRVRWVDYGPDFYAAQSWSDIPQEDGRRIWIAWMSNWRYANNIPTYPWRGAMSVPREVSLRRHGDQIHLVQQPIKELERLRGEPLRLENVTVRKNDDPLAGAAPSGTTFDILAEFEVDSAQRFGIHVRQGAGQVTRVGYDVAKGAVFVDRTRSGASDFHPEFSDIHYAPLKIENKRVALRVLVDRSSVELFANDGIVAITSLIFPDQDSDALSLFADDGQVRLRSLEIYPLKSIWTAEDACAQPSRSAAP